jgi:hypothetical protein
MRAGAVPVYDEAAAPPIRLRYLLILLVAGLAVWALVPRVRAAWQLQSAATAFADYALCMVGPTGPALLRDNPAEFRRLARRRLIATAPDDRPFSRCAKGAALVMQAVANGSAIERAHRSPSASFVEYGAATARDAVTLDHLAVSTRGLAELSRTAWPFVRGGYTSLVQPSAYANGAAHPMELPRPGLGRGVGPARSLARCDSGTGSPAFEVGLSADRRRKIVRSVTPEGVASDATLAPADSRVFAVSCDSRGAVVALGHAGTREVEAFTCSYLGSCTRLSLPRFGAAGPLPAFPLDVARVDGVVIVAVPMHGIVRVASSRDEGRTWTPYTVAFDTEAHPDLRYDIAFPDHLFVTEHRVLLQAVTAQASRTFPVLASDDAGASWHAP